MNQSTFVTVTVVVAILFGGWTVWAICGPGWERKRREDRECQLMCSPRKAERALSCYCMTEHGWIRASELESQR